VSRPLTRRLVVVTLVASLAAFVAAALALAAGDYQ
jgi:hypothetical protein